MIYDEGSYNYAVRNRITYLLVDERTGGVLRFSTTQSISSVRRHWEVSPGLEGRLILRPEKYRQMFNN